MNINRQAIQRFAVQARIQMDAGALEDVLRHMLSAQLPRMFPDNPWWIIEHSTGAEQNVHYIDTRGHERTGFVDSLVGKTAIEYEKNLSIRAVFDEGYHQVETYCAALLNRGILEDDIIGVLSDTLRWISYRVVINNQPPLGVGYGPDNISLVEIEQVDISDASDLNVERFGLFIYRYLGREGSRILQSNSLAADMGLESDFCRDHLNAFRTVVDVAFTERVRYANMIATLWQSFVARLGGIAGHEFDRDSYTNELYIVTMSKLLCANILTESALLSGNDELARILNGKFFKEKGLLNLVEYDYFGWLNDDPYIQQILPIARQMQNDLLAYDFTEVMAEDLFGPLVAQLAAKERRLLLGQEYTPQWLAKKVVAKILTQLPAEERPNMVDMCCGSGVFIVEAIKQVVEKYNINGDARTEDDLNMLKNCVVGFDIDPLAVMLSKVNWVLATKGTISALQGDITIPVYHADSFFSATPLALVDPGYVTQSYTMLFDGEEVSVPGFLITPENRSLFDIFIQNCYDVAKALAETRDAEHAPAYTVEQASVLVERLLDENGSNFETNAIEQLTATCCSLINTLAFLQRDGRNGIWSFVLGNSYRPGLVTGQFNAIISNPPWMAMSKLADNPYKESLISRSTLYGIRPAGSSHLHIELASVFLLNAIDKYLKDNAVFGCVMPQTILNGYHHEPFRMQNYISAEYRIGAVIREIWSMPTDTFKNKAIVLFGQKNNQRNSLSLAGRFVSPDMPDVEKEFRLIRQGRRSAWSDNPNARTLTDGVLEKIHFLQGADIMPRTLVFHKCIQQQNGKWAIYPIPRQGDELSYLVGGGKIKKHKDFSISAVNMDGRYLFDCYESEHVLPFYLCNPAKALLPMKIQDGTWRVSDEQELATFGPTVLAAFNQIFTASGETAAEYFNRINYRNKLSPQIFTATDIDKWLVMAGAGGGYPCAAYIPVSEIIAGRTVIIDQTIYWYLATSEDEALYITGLMNSKALDGIISDFQPEGAQGRRHVHKLPYNVTPPFNPENDSHLIVVSKTRALKGSLLSSISNTPTLSEQCLPSHSTLQYRRRRMREFMQSLTEYNDYEDACRDVYGV